MIVVSDPAEAGARAQDAAVAIGNFDGLHLGHARVLARLAEEAAGAPRVVMSFRPHPSEVLGGRPSPARLLSDAQRDELLSAAGIDVLLLQRFDRELSELSPAGFADRVLVEALGARVVVVGESFLFGRGRSGDLRLLQDLLRERGAEAVGVPALSAGGEVISSTRIRGLVARGDVEAARALLGRPYVLEGLVVAGDRRGRTLGFPTANVDAPGRALPATGVYAAVAARGSSTWQAVVNVGLRPTFESQAPAPRAEVHVLGEPGDLYGATLRVAFLRRLREERRFAGPAELAARIRADVDEARAALEGIEPAGLRGPGF